MIVRPSFWRGIILRGATFRMSSIRQLILSHKLWYYTRISGPEKSRNNTREKIWYISCVDIVNQPLTRHSPLAPLGQVDE